MDDLHISQLIAALRDEKPVILFLGQEFSSDGQGGDRVLNQFLARLGLSSESGAWTAVFGNPPIKAQDYEWLSERFDRRVYSDAVCNMLDVGWSSVFTSSIDPKLLLAMESRGRAPEAILARDHFARVPRSRSRPGIHYLFGKVDETEPQYRSPRTRAEAKQRISVHANDFINRISETATPLGLLVIDGYHPGRDWLPVDDLLAALSHESSTKILWFGLAESPESDFFDELVASGKITVDSRPLSVVITAIQATVEGPLGSTSQSETGTISLGTDKIFRVSPSLRLRVEASAAIIDDTWTDEQPQLGRVDESEAFRRFHGDLVGTRGMIEGVSRGYAIRREFESVLTSTVERYLRGSTGADSLVLHGQSGVGKSVAMARLAWFARTNLRVPVLFSWGRVPTPYELDDFCAEGERAGAVGTLILCDANQSYDRYRELATGLKSRGRRALVVGTSYRLEGIQTEQQFILAGHELSSLELESLTGLLARFGTQDEETIKKALNDRNVLALLYRYISASRARIMGGVADEARAAEQMIRLRARSMPKTVNVKSLLAEKLIALGLAEGRIAVFEDDVEGAEAGVDAAGQLIDYVMAVGRLDCAVPVNLVIRAIQNTSGNLDITQISYLFNELDLFRWRMADAEGNDLLLQPRLQLEAELICKRRLANIDSEVDCVTNLIGAVRSSAVDRNAELDFLLDLLPKLNRDGPRGKAYEQGYLRIASALTTLRTVHLVRDARLILQESAFKRAAVHAMDKSDLGAADRPVLDRQREEILNEAREAVEVALDAIGDKKLRASRKTQHHLLNERASIYGYLTVGLARTNANEDEVWPNYLAARTAISRAMSVGGSYYSQDVGMWTPHDILTVQNLDLSPSHRAELKADILAVIDEVNAESLSPGAAQKFHARRLKVSEAIGENELAEDAFNELEKIVPSVAYFLKARSMCPGIFQTDKEKFAEDIRTKAKEAAVFLEERFEKIAGDARALQLLLQLRWIAYTGHRLLRLERFPIPGDRAFLEKILKNVSDLNRSAGDGARNVYRFLEATLEWVLGDIHRARELFRELARDTEFEDPSRVVRRLVLEAKGEEQSGFRGRVEKQRSDGHWVISVAGYQGTIDLLERDFSNEDLRPGREIRRFNIAFNYLGPIADPILRHGSQT
jgi:hypothetical protein